MRSATPPYGWTQRELEGRTLFIGFDFAPWWPLLVLWLGGSALGYPTFRESLVRWIALTVVCALLALARGFRLEVSARGFTLWRTWCWIPYWRLSAPLDAPVYTSGGFGDPDEEMVIETSLPGRRNITLGSQATCEDLCRAVRSAQDRWSRSSVVVEASA